MGRFFVVALSALLFVSVGCQSDHKHDGSHHKGDAMKASADACTHCPGVQKATADGKCPVCAMQTGATGASSSAGDACTHCAGVQTATAAGKCSACGMEVAKKQ